MISEGEIINLKVMSLIGAEQLNQFFSYCVRERTVFL